MLSKGFLPEAELNASVPGAVFPIRTRATAL
jgi:hypothetical protein